MNAEQIQAARDALECAGELVTYTDAGGVSKSIWVRIAHSVEIHDPEGGLVMKTTTLRAVKPDVVGMTKAAIFTREDDTEWVSKTVLTDNHVTVLLAVGEKQSV